MRAADRDAEMARFRDGDLDVLVGTTVVEVGVDVPEATMMIVEDADRFGLAQLHQLRGRVGRGESNRSASSSPTRCDPVARPGSRPLAATHDGFELAEKDFELRREGDVLGLTQSGLPRLRVASLQRDDHRELAVAARGHAETMLDERRPALARSRRRAGRELDVGLAGARGRRRAGQRRLTSRWLTPGGSSPGRPPAAGSRRRRDRAPDRWPTGSSRPSSRSSSRDLPGAGVLDLFAGSGAAGIEALSRGAAAAVFVERDAGGRRGPSTRTCRTTGLAGPAATVVRADALAWLGGAVAAAGPSTSSSSTRPTPTRELLRRGPRAPRRRDAPLAPGRAASSPSTSGGTPAGADRAASIGAGAPLRRDGAHVLPRVAEEVG